jgi:membrane dipeptidase
MLMDCSHTGYRTSMDIMAASRRPVIFSHSNVRALKDHPRNIRDDQIDACAATGGVIGLSGIGIFIGANDIRTESLLRHIDHVSERVGPDHAGLGLDFVFDQAADDLPPGVDPAAWWPPGNEYGMGSLSIVPPEQLPEIAEALLRHGYSEAEARGILGENFLRVAGATWPAAAR